MQITYNLIKFPYSLFTVNMISIDAILNKIVNGVESKATKLIRKEIQVFISGYK